MTCQHNTRRVNDERKSYPVIRFSSFQIPYRVKSPETLCYTKVKAFVSKSFYFSSSFFANVNQSCHLQNRSRRSIHDYMRISRGESAWTLTRILIENNDFLASRWTCRSVEMAPPFQTSVLGGTGAPGKVMKTGQSRVPCQRERLSYASFALLSRVSAIFSPNFALSTTVSINRVIKVLEEFVENNLLRNIRCVRSILIQSFVRSFRMWIKSLTCYKLNRM